MKNLSSIKNAIKTEKQFYRLHNVDACINNALAQMWSNENAVNAFICCVNADQCYLLLLTDQNRLISCRESQKNVSGLLFDRTEYSHSAYAYDMTGSDPDKCRCIERKVGGFFGSTYYDVIFEGQSKPLTLTFDDLSQAHNVMNAVLSNIKKCKKPIETPTVNATPSRDGSAIAEIRKMYEDGLIDKEEMLDLIKSLNK